MLELSPDYTRFETFKTDIQLELYFVKKKDNY